MALSPPGFRSLFLKILTCNNFSHTQNKLPCHLQLFYCCSLCSFFVCVCCFLSSKNGHGDTPATPVAFLYHFQDSAEIMRGVWNAKSWVKSAWTLQHPRSLVRSLSLWGALSAFPLPFGVQVSVARVSVSNSDMKFYGMSYRKLLLEGFCCTTTNDFKWSAKHSVLKCFLGYCNAELWYWLLSVMWPPAAQ